MDWTIQELFRLFGNGKSLEDNFQIGLQRDQIRFKLRWDVGLGIEDCVCDAGYTGDPCSPCAGGTAKDSTGSQSCYFCNANFYSELSSASTRCLSCPDNSYSPSGSDELSDCICNAEWGSMRRLCRWHIRRQLGVVRIMLCGYV